MKDFINDCLLKSLTAVAVLAGMFSLSSCEDKPVPPLPEIVLGDEAMQFGHEGGSDTFVLYVNRGSSKPSIFAGNMARSPMT